MTRENNYKERKNQTISILIFTFLYFFRPLIDLFIYDLIVTLILKIRNIIIVQKKTRKKNVNSHPQNRQPQKRLIVIHKNVNQARKIVNCQPQEY